MELLVEKVGDVSVVTLKAEYVDASNCREFKDRINELLPSVKHLLLDLGKVQFIDSTGLAGLLTCLKQMTVQGGDMKVCCITSPVRALFDLVKMNRIVEVCKTRDDAFKTFAPQA